MRLYHHFENGFDERLDYQTLAEAEQAAQQYVAGTMEGEDGFAYDGAGIYDLNECRWLRVYGDFPDERAIEQAALAAEELQASQEQDVLQPKKEEPAPLPPKRPRRERITFTTLHPEIPRDQRHDFHITDDALGHGAPSEKYAANAAAIRTLKQIEAEERLATPEEQEILSRYVGWGGLADCFEETSPHYEELKSPAGFRGIRGGQGQHPHRLLHAARGHPGNLQSPVPDGLYPGQHPGTVLRHRQFPGPAPCGYGGQQSLWCGAGFYFRADCGPALPERQHFRKRL